MSYQKVNTEEDVVQEATQEIPILNVDEAKSVEERFTDNAIDNILPARYLVKDDEGEVVEEPNELFERVAENVAKAELTFGERQGISEEKARARFDQWRGEFEELMKTQRFMPNSPTLMNAGARLQQLSACFVDSPQDDLYDIAETELEWTMVQKTGGGMGGDFSKLRPKGALVDSTKGTSSGPISFMKKKYNNVAGVIKQGGVRRGAQMAEIRVDHPDIGRFAVSKREEGALDNFNISASVTDEFVEAVREDSTYTLYSPRSDFEEPFEIVEDTAHFYSPKYADQPETVVDENLWRDNTEGMLAWDWDNEETVSFDEKWKDQFETAAEEGRFDEGTDMILPARFIWDLILDGAWRNGEPGLFYLDETNDKHSFDVEEHPEYKIFATNPCFDGSTLLYTDSGMKSAEELYESGNPVSVVTDSRMGGERVEEATNVFKTGNKDVYKLNTEEGYSINVTEDHEIMTSNGWVEAQNLTQSDSIDILDGKGAFGSGGSKELGEVLGWFVGDGHAKNGEERAVLNFYEDDHELTERFENNVNSVIRDPIKDRDYSVSANEINRSANQVMESRIRSERLYEVIEEAGLTEDKYQVPEQIFTGSEETVRGFLQALFSADGTVSNYGSTRNIRLSSTSKDMLQDVQKILGNFGIACRIYEDRKEAGTTTLPDSNRNDAEYERQALHEIHISKSNLETFQSEIGFLRSDKSEKLSAVLDSYSRGPEEESFTATFESLEYLGERPVYDITQPNTNSLIAENINISNCAEQPLCEYEACNLGHINLSLMLEEGCPTYDEWIESTDYDYTTDQAAAYDYFEEAVDFDELDRVIEAGTRFLDNVVTQSEFPLEEIQDTVSSMRKIGLGVMGWAQMCYQMGVRYGSEESLQLARVTMNYIDEQATKTSHELAEERGCFDAWDKSKYADPTEYTEWFQSHAYEMPEDHEDGYAMRNHNVTTVAPTGTTSMLGDTSGGIEPVYSVAYKKNVGEDIQGDEMLVEFDKVFIKTLEANESDLDHTVQEIADIAAEQMDNNEFEGVHGLPVPQWMKETFVTTQDLPSDEHGLMQRAFQEGVDSGISKTVNLPKEATHKDVHEAYMLALSDEELGAPIKGLTVYRDQSRGEQVLTTQEYSDKDIEQAIEMLEQLDYEVEEPADEE